MLHTVAILFFIKLVSDYVFPALDPRCLASFFYKSFLNLLQYCFCFMFWFFGPEACGILAPQPGIEPTHPALEGEVLTTGPPGKSSMRMF